MKLSGASWPSKVDKIGLNSTVLTSMLDIRDKDALFITIGNKNDSVRLEEKINLMMYHLLFLFLFSSRDSCLVEFVLNLQTF